MRGRVHRARAFRYDELLDRRQVVADTSGPLQAREIAAHHDFERSAEELVLAVLEHKAAARTQFHPVAYERTSNAPPPLRHMKS